MRANLATLVDEFRLHAADTAVVVHRGNRSYRTTYGELTAFTGRFTAELARRNIAPGDRVVLWGENSAEWIAVFFGCILRAAIVVPLDAAGSPDFAARIIADVRPKLIVGDAHLLASLPTDNLQPATPQLPLTTIAAHLPAEPLFTPSDTIQPHTPFQIVFTSGTTAEPRGIVHTHRNILVSLEPIEKEMRKYLKYERIFHPLRFLHLLPLSHVFGQFMGLWCPALLGAEVHFAQELEPARTTELIHRERVSVLIAVPRVLHLLRVHLLTRFPMLAAEIDSLAMSSQPGGMRAVLNKWWRFRRVHGALGWKFWAVISGGATLPAEIEAFWNCLGFALIQGYGMTETAALVTLNHPFHIKQGSIGKPLPGRDVQVSAEGEILVRGEILAEATWAAGAMHKREGEWLATGDLAETSASGELKFLGRKGDVIVTSAGLNIHPADLESALTAQPSVRAAAVVACDINAGPEPVAVVLTTLSEAELQAAVDAANRTLAEFQQIRRVLRWRELEFPFTSTGKLIRRQVAAWACATLNGNRAGSTPAATQDSLLALIAEVTGEPAPIGVEREERPQGLKPTYSAAVYGTAEAVPLSRTTDVPLTRTADALRLSEDLHLDSLGRVQLQSALEQRFSIELEDDAIATTRTVGDLRALVESSVDSSQFSVESQPATSIKPALKDAAEPASRQGQLRTNNRELTTEHSYPRWPWTWPIQIIRVLWIELIMRPLVWLFAAPRVVYTSPQLATWNLQPATPLLILSNHITAYDGAFILYALPRRLRHRVAAAMSGEMLLDYRAMRNQGNALLNLLAPAAYWLLTALFNVFPLPNGRGFRRSFAHAGEALDRGYSVLIFPEGTRSRVGHMNPFRPGIGLLAEQSRVPILPIALHGLYDLADSQPATRHWFHSGRIEVHIGALIPAATDSTDPAVLTAQLEEAVHALLIPAANPPTKPSEIPRLPA